MENSAAVGEYFKAQLVTLNTEIIHEVRGKGLMIAVELTPEAGGARQYCEALKTQGILCKETHDHIIRFSPPLVLTNEQVDWAIERIGSTFRDYQTQMHVPQHDD